MKRPEEDETPWKTTKKPEDQACDIRNLPSTPLSHMHTRAKFHHVVENKGTVVSETTFSFKKKKKVLLW